MSAIIKSKNPQFSVLTDQDLSIIMEIENQSYDFPWSEGIFRDCMRVGYHCITMKMDKKIVAYSVFSVSAGEAHILNLCVGSPWRGNGYSRQILQYVIDCAGRLKAAMCFLEVRESNQVAIRLYDTFGFNQIGVRKDYYPAFSGREDAIIYALQFDFQ